MKWNRNHSLPLSAIVLFFPPLEIDLESRLIGRMTRRGLLKSPPLFGSSVQFYLSLCSLSKIILVWPKGRKVLGSTIQSRGTNRGEPCLDIVRFLMVNTKELFRAYIPDSKSIPFKLGFLDHPGHPVQTNTYKNSLREACWPLVTGAYTIDVDFPGRRDGVFDAHQTRNSRSDWTFLVRTAVFISWQGASDFIHLLLRRS
jgi:hypothetical protein